MLSQLELLEGAHNLLNFEWECVTCNYMKVPLIKLVFLGNGSSSRLFATKRDLSNYSIVAEKYEPTVGLI